MTKTPASLRSDPGRIHRTGGRFASESVAEFSGIRNVPCVSMPAVKIECVAGLKWLHQLGEVGLGSLQEKVDVVG